jgi:chromate reductase, NAD(P)H dehydrogenase (quinone)
MSPESSTMATHSVLLLPGSLRAGSYTTAILRAAGDLLPDDFSGEIVDLIRPLPYYDGDLDDDPLPAAVIDIRAKLGSAGGLIIATPEYNGMVPGGLKNWVDWATRPFRAHSLIGTPVVVFGASPGGRGALGAVTWLADILARLGLQVVGESVTVPTVATKVAEDGKVDPQVIDQLRPLVDSFVEAVRAKAIS